MLVLLLLTPVHFHHTTHANTTRTHTHTLHTLFFFHTYTHTPSTHSTLTHSRTMCLRLIKRIQLFVNTLNQFLDDTASQLVCSCVCVVCVCAFCGGWTQAFLLACVCVCGVRVACFVDTRFLLNVLCERHTTTYSHHPPHYATRTTAHTPHTQGAYTHYKPPNRVCFPLQVAVSDVKTFGETCYCRCLERRCFECACVCIVVTPKHTQHTHNNVAPVAAL